jgi:hypothetical protein
MSQDVVSFVLRFVREMGEDQQARWRGVIKHVQGDSESHFSQFSEAMEFMQARVNEVILATFEGSKKANEDNPFMETARLWGQWMPRYTKLMMDSMNEAAGGNANLAQQMEKTMAATMSMWGLPSQQDQARSAATLETMAAQVADLTAKLEKLEAYMATMNNAAAPVAEPKPGKRPASRPKANPEE